ncbi:MAG: DUF4266 domain-containing protein [Cyclobacteriaceae bacterium]|nr:DUF4266 domain-containing protein [Cyclobacteriaceae bacterium]
MHIKYRILVVAGVLSIICSCESVKPYQRSYLNDSSMQMGLTKGGAVENYAQTIREGASGGGGKSSGGCGCN